MNLSYLKGIVAVVEVPGMTVTAGRREGGGDLYVQGEFSAPCADNPDQVRLQKTRKWLISQHATNSEVVQTIFKLALTSAEHELREGFKYFNRPVFGPHFDVDQLWKLCGQADAKDVRHHNEGEPA